MTDEQREPITSEARQKRISDALATFMTVLRWERAPFDMDVPDAFSGLNDDEKRVLFLLQRRSARRNAQKTAIVTDALTKARASPAAGNVEQIADAKRSEGAQGDPKVSTDDNTRTPPEKEPRTVDAATPERLPPRAGAPSSVSDLDKGDANADAHHEPAPEKPEKSLEDRAHIEDTGQKTQPEHAPEKTAIADVPGMGRTFPVRPMEIRLPNARVRKAYSAASDRPVLKVVDDAGSGISVDADGALVGTPESAGDYVLSLQIADPDGSPRPAKARLTVIADPRDLWVSHPSDSNAPYWKEDGVVVTQTSADAFLLAGSLRGRSHAQKGGFREDDVALRITKAGWHILVVADGAGSAELSRHASRIAVETAADAIEERAETHLGERLDRHLSAWSVKPEEEMMSIRRDLLYPVLAGAALKATNALVKTSQASDTPFREYSTTLLCAIARPTIHGWMIASFSVGDGGIVAFDTSTGEIDLLCAPDSGEYAGQTNFLTPGLFEDPQSVIERIHCVIRPSFTALAVMSDGITDPFFPTDAALEDPAAWSRFWNEEIQAGIKPMSRNADQEQRMIDWLGFWSKGNHDDRTIALLIPKAGT